MFEILTLNDDMRRLILANASSAAIREQAIADGGIIELPDTLKVGAPVADAAEAAEAMVWSLYEQIRAQVLLIRGAESDLLTEVTARAMTERGPRARLLQWPGYGHAPTLTDPVHIDSLANFLLDPAA